eukprot:COSAG05_NODE_2211_length_3385_cov_160.566590_1_plen_61_part_00
MPLQCSNTDLFPPTGFAATAFGALCYAGPGCVSRVYCCRRNAGIADSDEEDEEARDAARG